MQITIERLDSITPYARNPRRNTAAIAKVKASLKQKPLECMAIPMRNNSQPGDAVYEPFSGSGTTLIAGENLGRKVRAIEISPAYVAVALERWATHTGQEPVLIDGP